MKHSNYLGRPGIEVVFTDGDRDLSLFYVIYEWPAAQRFYALVQRAVQQQRPLHSDTSFAVTEQHQRDLITAINRDIDEINQRYHSDIELISDLADLNRLHRQSTVAQGLLWQSINDKIHALEQYHSQRKGPPRANAYWRFLTDDWEPLQSHDYLFFAADRNYGDLCLNYTHKGKHWLELAADDDPEAIEDGQLQRETRLAATGYMLFRSPSPAPFSRLNLFREWFEQHRPGETISHEMAVGYLLVGGLVMPDHWRGYDVPERTQWTLKLCEHTKIREVKLAEIQNIDDLMRRSEMI